MKKKTVLILVAGLLLCFVTTVGAESSNVVKIGSDVTIEEGTKVHNVLAIGGQVTVDGVVENNIVSLGGSVVLTRTAVVRGNVFALGGIIVRGRGAEVHGNVTEINADDISSAIANALSEEWEGWSWIFAIVSVAIFLGVLLLTVLAVFLIPKPVRLIAAAVREKPFKVTVWGLAGLVLVVPLAVLLAVSVVGIVLIPLEMAIVLCAVLIGFISASQLVGQKLFAILKRQDQSMMRETVWGLIVLWLIGWIPYVGWMVKVCAIVLGLGGVLLTRFGTNQHT
jgi:MFS family permease